MSGKLLFRPQMSAAVVAILTGGYLGHSVHAGSFGTAEKILVAGALAALIAVVEQVGVPSFLVLSSF